MKDWQKIAGQWHHVVRIYVVPLACDFLPNAQGGMRTLRSGLSSARHRGDYTDARVQVGRHRGPSTGRRECLMKKKVEIAIRIDGAESFYVLPDTYDPPGGGDIACVGLDAEVDAVIRTTTNIQKMERNIIRLLVATACNRTNADGKLEVLNSSAPD